MSQAEAPKAPDPSQPPKPPKVIKPKALTDDLGNVTRGVAAFAPAELGRFLSVAGLPSSVVLVGAGDMREVLNAALTAAGKQVTLSEEVPEALPADAVAIWCGPNFDPAGYPPAAEMRRRFPGRVRTAFEVLSKVALWRSVGDLVGYHVAESKLVDFFVGERPPMGGLDRFKSFIEGKRVLEFGPLDGGMTAGLFHLGAAEVSVVEVRMVNVLKVLAAAHIFGWKNLKFILDDMNMVDAHSVGRFDFVVAHGVMYHTADPFQFLRNIASLGDVIFLGGHCAHPEQLRRPLVELTHEGHVYRAQPYVDKLSNDGGGAQANGYCFIVEDLQAFMERQGFAVELLDLVESPPPSGSGYVARFLCRRK